MTRKAPSGKRHIPCYSHIPHGYPSSGWLCITTKDPDRPAAMVAFADHLAAVAAVHRTAEIARWSVPSDPTTAMVATTDARTGEPGPFHPVIAHTDGAVHLPLASRANYASAAQLAVAPVKARKASPAVRASRRRELAAIAESLAPIDIVDRSGTDCTGPAAPDTVAIIVDGTTVAEYRHVNIAPDPAPAPEPTDWHCADCDADYPLPVVSHAVFHPPTAEQAEAQRVAWLAGDINAYGRWASEPAPEPARDTIDAIDDVENVAAALEVLAEPTAYLPAVVELAASIAEPVPVLAAVAAPGPTERPTCPRCGQMFRKSGAGLAWHVANRPDCGPAVLTVAV